MFQSLLCVVVTKNSNYTEHQLSKYGKKQPQEGIGIVGVVFNLRWKGYFTQQDRRNYFLEAVN